MPNGKFSWEELKKKYGNKYPDTRFWSWLKQAFPAGLERRHTTVLDSNFRNWDRQYQAQVQAGGKRLAGEEQATSLSGYYEQQYLAMLRDVDAQDVASGQMTQAEADAEVQKAQKILRERGLCSALPYFKEVVGFIEEDTGVNIGDEWKRLIEQYGQPVGKVGQYDAVIFEGHYYDTEGNRYDPSVENWIAQTLQRAQTAWERNQEAVQKAFGETQRINEQRKAFREMQVKGYPSRATYDIPVAGSAEEARAKGAARYIPEWVWNRPDVQQAKGTAYEEAMAHPTWLKDIYKREPTGGEEALAEALSLQAAVQQAQVPYASNYRDWVTGAMATGVKQAGIQARGERSPLGALALTPEEYRATKKTGMTSQESEAHKARMRLLSPEMRARLRTKEQEEKTKKEGFNWLDYYYGMGDYGASPPYLPSPSASPFARKWQPGIRESWLKEQLPATPAWMTPFVPGLTAGEPLRKLPMPTPSGQAWYKTTQSQRDILSAYQGWEGPERLSTWMPTRQAMSQAQWMKELMEKPPYEDLLGKMQMSRPRPKQAISWSPAQQRGI